MRRLLIVAAMVLCLPGMSEAQSCNGCGIGYWYNGVAASGGTFTGPILLPDGSASAPSLAFSGLPGMGIYRSGTTFLMVRPNNDIMFQFWGSSRLDLLSDAAQLSLGEAVDLILTRDAANTLALRNSTAAQQFNLYETYTDASNRSYLAIQATAGAFKLLPQAAGTGTLRVVAIGDGGAKPTCEAATRGGIWYDAGGAGAADTLEVCRKDAADAYAWVSLF